MGVNIRTINPANNRFVELKLPENICSIKAISEGASVDRIVEGKTAIHSNPIIIILADIHTPRRRTRLAHNSTQW